MQQEACARSSHGQMNSQLSSNKISNPESLNMFSFLSFSFFWFIILSFTCVGYSCRCKILSAYSLFTPCWTPFTSCQCFYQFLPSSLILSLYLSLSPLSRLENWRDGEQDGCWSRNLCSYQPSRRVRPYLSISILFFLPSPPLSLALLHLFVPQRRQRCLMTGPHKLLFFYQKSTMFTNWSRKNAPPLVLLICNDNYILNQSIIHHYSFHLFKLPLLS